jgi:hypothetical protein
MNKTGYILLLVMMLNILSASTSFADQSGQNSPANAPAANTIQNKPVTHNANQVKSGNGISHRGAGTGTLGGTAKSNASINGTSMRRLPH